MIDGGQDYANDPLKGLVKAYLKRRENTERLRKQYAEYLAIYDKEQAKDSVIEKILANRIKEHAVIGPLCEVVTANKYTGYAEYHSLTIKQAVK